MEAFSVAVFGSRHRLSVLAMAATARPDELYAQAIADRLATKNTGPKKVIEAFTRRQLTALERASLLARNDSPPQQPAGRGGRPPRLLCRSEDEFWKCLQELGDRFRQPSM
jgi:hypothetical protein